MTPTYRIWKGSYFDGVVAKRHPVSVALTGGGIAIGLPESAEVRVWPYAEIRVSEGGIGDGIRVERGAGSPEVLVLEASDFLPALSAYSPRLRASPVPAGPAVPRLGIALGVAIGLLVLVALAYFRGIPALAEQVAARVPVAWEEQIGAALVSQIVPEGSVCEAPELEKALAAILDRLVGSDTRDPYRYRLTIRDDPGLNALAAPGGHIVVFRGLLEEAETPEEVAGVLAHEIQHVRLQHGTQAVLREVPLRLVSVVLAGDIGAIGQVAGAAATLGSLRHRRADEEAADRGGMQMIRGARIAPDAMVRFFTRLEEAERRLPELPTYLSTHPSNDSRIAALERMAANAVYVPVPLLEDYDWENRVLECRVRS